MVVNFAKKAYNVFIRSLPAEASLQLQFLRHQGGFFDRVNPRTFSEKIQALKLSEPSEQMILLADKYEAKRIVSDLLGPDWITPTLWSGFQLPPIAERNWPVPFVIKASHASGWNIFVREGEDLDWERIERQCQDWMSSDFAPELYETWYNRSNRRILVEPFIGDIETHPLDYRFFTFGGRVHYIAVDTGTNRIVRRVFFDRSWIRQNFRVKRPLEMEGIERPSDLDAMILAAERIASGLPFARVDFYQLPSGPRFSEVTFAPGSGFQRFYPRAMDAHFGKLWV